MENSIFMFSRFRVLDNVSEKYVENAIFKLPVEIVRFIVFLD